MIDPRCHRVEASSSRRDFLFSAGLGLGAMAFSDLLGKELTVPAPGVPLQAGVGLSVGPGRRASANAQPTAPTDPAFAALCHALLNSSEFFYLE